MDAKILHMLKQSTVLLDAGEIIAYPTETFYALGVRYDDSTALSRLSALKLRSQEKAFPLIIGDLSQIELLVSAISQDAKSLIERFWPGPLTLLFDARENLHPLITLDKSVAIRIPGDSFALQLVKYYGVPITSTSCNISSMPPAVNADDVLKYFSAQDVIVINAGNAPGGMPSTILDVRGNKIKCLRQGAIPISCITDIAGVNIY